MKVLGKKAIVKLFKEEKTTAGGIVIPDSAKQGNPKGEVVAFGDESKLNLGDKVTFLRHTGTMIDHDHVLLRDEEVLFIE